jgi:hypothetical protein
MEMNRKTESRITDRKTRMAILSLLVAVAVLFTFVISPQTIGQQVYAADYEQWEDCDWDGYDDHTGVKVPWVGFDGTRGDTPAGPSADSQTGKKKAAEEKAAKEKEEAEKAAKEKKAKEKAAAAKEKAAKEKAAKEKAAKDKAAKDKAAAADDKKTEEETDVKTTDTEEEEKPDETTEAAAEETPAETPEEVTQEEIITTEAPLPDAAVPQALIDEAIVQQQGEIEVKEAEGAALHAGSKIVISGYGFYGDVAELDVEIHSTPTPLGKVGTDADGYFELTVTVPEDIEEGTHNIVVLYQGQEITRQPVELAPAAADSFIKALTVGFTGDNAELFAGLGILVALVVLGGLALGINGVVRGRRRGASGGSAVVGTPAATAPEK